MDTSDCASTLHELCAMLETTDWQSTAKYYVPSLHTVNKISKTQLSTPFDIMSINLKKLKIEHLHDTPKGWSQVTRVAENECSDASAEKWFSHKTRQAYERMHADLKFDFSSTGNVSIKLHLT